MLGLTVRIFIVALVAAACATPGMIQPPALATSMLAAARPTAAAPSVPAESRTTKSSPARAGDSVWTIQRGSYAGTTLALRFDSALGGGRDPEHFWRHSESAEDGGVVGWNTERFPIPVAFRRGGRSGDISASDSTAFWAIIGAMASDLGVAVFRPATIAAGSDPEDVIVVDVRLIAGIDGVSRITWKPSGELFDVRVTFRGTETLHDGHVVTHEMMHALGFGHTKAWKSIVNPSPYERSTRLSPDDVAYAEVAMGLRMKHEQSDMRQLIRLAVEQERGSADLLTQFAPDAMEWRAALFDDDMAQNCRQIPADLVAVVPACGKGLR